MTAKVTKISSKHGEAIVMDSPSHKVLKSEGYNFVFDKTNGRFARWGKKQEDDPLYAPASEIADIEIVAGGDCLGKCNFCYKCNNISSPKKVMTLEQFKEVFKQLPKMLTQIAFGITDIYANPDFFEIMRYCRENGVIPNYTTHSLDLDKNAVKLTSELCGAVAISLVNKEKSYDAVKAFTDAGMTQVNIHYMLSNLSYKEVFSLIDDVKKDPRLAKLNAIVFLQYKDKNPGSRHKSLLDVEKYRKLITYCESNKVNYGMDSCSAGIFLAAIKGRDNEKQLEQFVDSCESLRMSIYINVDCQVFPCSFCEKMPKWETGIKILELSNFDDIWFHSRVVEWRKDLINTMEKGCCHCPIYDLKF